MKISDRQYVYILKCSDDSYYTGFTNDLERRMIEHAEGRNPNCYTFNKRPVLLIYSEYFSNVNHAINREKQIQRWSRKKKEALIAGDMDALSYHAKSSVAKKLEDKVS